MINMNDEKKCFDCLPGVDCNVEHCRYNEISEKKCTAKHIKVKAPGSVNKDATFCDTFETKAGTQA